jgi:phage baseplate assembly protein gpV
MNVVMTGFVTDNQDPDNLGRVKIKIYLSEVETETNWLPIVAGFAGDDKGIYCLPDVDDFVLAVFIDNSYQKGYILGSTWTQDSALPTSEENSDADLNGDGNNALRMIRTKAGQRIILDDTDGSEKIQILNADATSRIELDAENELINLETEQGISLSAKTAVSITAEELSVELDKDLTISCKNLGFETSGDSSIKGDGGIALEGKGISLN